MKTQELPFDVYVLTETNLNSSFNSNELFTQDFNVFRKDGSPDGLISTGRGVLIAVHTNFDSSVLTIPGSDNIELICVRINNVFNGKTIYILCCYVRPRSQLETYQLLTHAVDFLSDSIDTHDDILVFGDFNLPNLNWSRSEDDTYFVTRNATTPVETWFTDSLLDSGLLQISNIKNNLGRQLDLVFSSDACNTVATVTDLILSIIDPYHPPILTTFCYENSSIILDSEGPLRFNFRKAHFPRLNELLMNIDFNVLLNNSDNIEIQTANFYSVIVKCFEQSVPRIRIKNRLSSPPWYNKELRTLRNRRNKRWQTFLKTKLDSDYSNYLSVYNDFSNLCNLLYNEYISLMQTEIKDNPKRFWQFVNLKKKSDGYPSSLSYNNKSSHDPKVIANQFADYFKLAFSNGVFEPDVNFFNYLSGSSQTSLISINIDYDTVVEKINQLSEDSSYGPDGLPPIVLIKCINSLALPLTILFQKSLSSGVFPSMWKDSFIVPVHKKGSKSEISNYRPIAKLSCIPKLFESIVYDALCFHCKSLISPIQHGFIRGRSTTTNLMLFVSETLSTLEKGGEIDLIATDFSKAFDKISHKLILFKLRALGLPSHFLNWVDSYLADRNYQVIFRSSISESFRATSGVPQGSHLGPILFVLSINDVECVIKNSCISVYADDMKIYRQISISADSQLLQNDLNNFVVWCAKNDLELNVSKCLTITYSRKRVPAPPRDYLINDALVLRVFSILDLGVFCDSELNFRCHVGNIISRANSVLGFVKRWSKEFLDPNVTKILYTTFVRPLLEYACQVWSPYYDVHINRIEAVQRRFLRFALRGLPWIDNYNLPPYIDRLKLINLHSLVNRRLVADVTFVHQILSGAIDCPPLLFKVYFNVNPRTLRNPRAFRPPPHRTEYGLNEPITRMLREVNNNFEIFDYDISKFTLKKRLFATF